MYRKLEQLVALSSLLAHYWAEGSDSEDKIQRHIGLGDRGGLESLEGEEEDQVFGILDGYIARGRPWGCGDHEETAGMVAVCSAPVHMEGERFEQVLRGGEVSHSDQDHSQWNSACTDVVVYLLKDLS